MDENNKDNTFSDQYTDIKETINQGNVAAEDVAPGDAAAKNVATLNAATA